MKSRRNKRWKGLLYSVEITNTDPAIIEFFLKYLRKGFNVQNERIKVQLQIHQGDNQEELESYYSKTSWQ